MVFRNLIFTIHTIALYLSLDDWKKVFVSRFNLFASRISLHPLPNVEGNANYVFDVAHSLRYDIGIADRIPYIIRLYGIPYIRVCIFDVIGDLFVTSFVGREFLVIMFLCDI